MINRIVFEDEITLWWQEEDLAATGLLYQCYLDDVYHGTTDKTHYTFASLAPDTTYRIRLEVTADGAHLRTELLTVSTGKAKKRLDVTAAPYGAIGDGETLATAALQRALDDCTGEDCVYLPAGTYLTGALDVHSDTEIYLAPGAVLQGTTDPGNYLPKIPSRFEGYEMECYRSLINIGRLSSGEGYNCKNVVIRGAGSILGGGAALAKNTVEAERERLREYLSEHAEYIKTCDSENAFLGRARGRLINISNADGVVLAGLSLGYGASWTVHFVYSRNVVTYGCSIFSLGVENGDGWDPDSSEDCTVFDTLFETHDNGIAIKSGKNPEAQRIGRPTKNIRIFDCRGSSDIAIGSELSGGVEGVYIWHCTMLNSWGINIKTTAERGGYVRNVNVFNSSVSSITVRTRLSFNNDGESANELTELRDFRFVNLRLQGVFVNAYAGGRRSLIPPISIDGFADKSHPIENVLIRNIWIPEREDGTMQAIVGRNVKNMTIENLQME